VARRLDKHIFRSVAERLERYGRGNGDFALEWADEDLDLERPVLKQTPLEKPFERKVSGFRFRVSGI